uniref:Uncharacterized protein n=1 Tax=Plectus sambesii TaxID=2011161 RepID=A0A914X7Q7_9BILA
MSSFLHNGSWWICTLQISKTTYGIFTLQQCINLNLRCKRERKQAGKRAGRRAFAGRSTVAAVATAAHSMEEAGAAEGERSKAVVEVVEAYNRQRRNNPPGRSRLDS